MSKGVKKSAEASGPIPTGTGALELAITWATRVVEALDCEDRALSYYAHDVELCDAMDGSGKLWEEARVARQNLRRYYSKRLDRLYEVQDGAVKKAVAQQVARALKKAGAS
jgi:hypothetical protein